jgi:hypothetical protein
MEGDKDIPALRPWPSSRGHFLCPLDRTLVRHSRHERSIVQHIVIAGRIYRIVTVEAGDAHQAREHISAQRPIGYTTALEIRGVSR